MHLHAEERAWLLYAETALMSQQCGLEVTLLILICAVHLFGRLGQFFESRVVVCGSPMDDHALKGQQAP